MDNHSILDDNLLAIDANLDEFYANSLVIKNYNKNAILYSRLLILSWIFVGFFVFSLLSIIFVVIVAANSNLFQEPIGLFLISVPILVFFISIVTWYNIQVGNYVKVIKGFIALPNEDTFNLLMNRRSKLILIQVMVCIIALLITVISTIIEM